MVDKNDLKTIRMIWQSISMNEPLLFAGFISIMEISYFVTGYLFWLDHNCNNFLWIGEYSFFPSSYNVGFVAILAAAIPIFLMSRKTIRLDSWSLKVVIFGFAFMNSYLVWNIPEFNPDAVLYHYYAKIVSERGLTAFLINWGHGIPASTVSPLASLIFGISYKVFGEHRIVIQAVNASFFSITAILVASVAEEFISRRALAYAGLLFGCSPFIVSQTPLMLVDVIATFFVTLDVYLAALVARRDSWRYPILLGVVAVLSVMTKYSAAFYVLLILAALVIVMVLKDRKAGLQKSLILFASASLLSLPVIYLKYDVLLSQYLRLTSAFGVLPVNREFLRFYSYIFSKTVPIAVSIPIFASGILAALLTVLKRMSKYRKPALLLLAWLAISTWFFFSPLIPNSAVRYVMPTFPVYVIFEGMLLCNIKNARLRRASFMLLLVFSMTTLHMVYAETWRQSVSGNIMRAGQYLEQEVGRQSEVLVVYPEMAYWFDIYTSRVIVDLDAPPSMPQRGNLSDYLKGRLPEYIVIVSSYVYIKNETFYSNPEISPAEEDFLDENYLHIKRFQGGSLQGPWWYMIVDIYRRTSALLSDSQSHHQTASPNAFHPPSYMRQESILRKSDEEFISYYSILAS